MAIQDSGSGIASSHLSKIFDPFYTTKKACEGTGLGLSISYGIIQEHDGRLWVESSLNQGAIFRIEIPVQTEEVMSESNAHGESAHPEISPKKILVVDDEQEIGAYLRLQPWFVLVTMWIPRWMGRRPGIQFVRNSMI